MKIFILDPEKKVKHRISKDTSGGYGTGNDFGDTIIPVFLKKTLKIVHDWAPMFAVYTISVLKKYGHEVHYSKIPPNDLNSFDLYIVVSSIVCCETECENIRNIAKFNKKVFVIGPFATSNPKKYIEAGGTVILGEPEFFFLKDQDLNDVENNKIISFQHEFVLDDLPYPDWESVSKNTNASSLFGGGKSLPILATRGCPYSCFKYCVYPLQQGRKPRSRDVVKIVDELEYWYKKLNVKMFVFRDPVFSINKKHTIEFCEELIKRKLKIRYIIETHLRILDGELIKILKQSGLKAVKVGVESGDEEVLKDVNRFTIKKDEQLSKIRELEKNNILVSAMFIIGFPTDDKNSIMKTINYAKKLNTTFAQFSVWTPYPGTPVFKEYEDRIIAKNYEEFDQYNLVFKHNVLSAKEIRELLGKTYTLYYGRLSWFFKFLKNSILA
ncbi:radical SAM protein [Candidatus Pelagibacter sp.]|nr:radical SAM protein [Candidatus Pelagibacter sp.]